MSELPSRPSALVYLLPGLHRPKHRRGDPQPAVLLQDASIAYRKNCANIVTQLVAMDIAPRVAEGVKDHAFLLPLEEIAWHEKHRNKYRVANNRKVRDYEKERAALEEKTPSLHDLDLFPSHHEDALRWLSRHTTGGSKHKHKTAVVFGISPIPLTPPWTKANGYKAAPTFVGSLCDGTKVYRYRSGGVKTNATALGLDTRSESLDEAWFTAEEYAKYQKFQTDRTSKKAYTLHFKGWADASDVVQGSFETTEHTDAELDALQENVKSRLAARELLRIARELLAKLTDPDLIDSTKTMIERLRKAAYSR